jgi:hypothetical protein
MKLLLNPCVKTQFALNVSRKISGDVICIKMSFSIKNAPMGIAQTKVHVACINAKYAPLFCAMTVLTSTHG